MQELFYRCTACRRCTLECPMGIDHALITHLGRYILSELGIIPKGLEIAVIEQLEGKTGNTSAIPAHALVDTLEFLEEEMLETVGVELKFPVDQEDRDFVFFPAVSDYLMEPETLMGNALVLWAAGDWDRWTIGTGYFDGINYGLFYSDHVLEKIIQEADRGDARLKGKTILIGECGTRRGRRGTSCRCSAAEVPGRQLHGVHAPRAPGGQAQARPRRDHRGGHLPRPLQHRPLRWIVEQPRKIIRSFCKQLRRDDPGTAATTTAAAAAGARSPSTRSTTSA
jgi:hypothetical protein